MGELADDPEMAPVIEENRAEIELFRACHDAYGYVFYVLQRPAV